MKAEWIMLADHVETINNKLYLMGGGWEALTVGTLPTQHILAVAVSFSAPWNETNQVHDIGLEIGDQDGNPLASIQGQIEVGRPPGLPLGHAQQVQVGFNIDLSLEKPGLYFVAARVEGQESKRVNFNVLEGAGFIPQPGHQ